MDGEIGKAYGLAWTPEGTNLIQIQAKVTKAVRGRGDLYVRGEIGDAVLHSIYTACGILAASKELDITSKNMALDIPGKLDGPSAGLPIFMCLYSALSKRPVNQRIAFTGAINDMGAILPVDAIEDKLVAAYSAKFEGVALPIDNLATLPPNVGEGLWGKLVLCPVTRIADAIAIGTV